MDKVFLAQYWQIYDDEEPACHNPTAVCKTRERGEQFVREMQQQAWKEYVSDQETEVDNFNSLYFAEYQLETLKPEVSKYLASLEEAEYYPKEMPKNPDVCDYLVRHHFGYDVELGHSVEEVEVLE